MLFLWYPKCTTCQKAKQWLDEHEIPYETRDIKLQNPTEAELREWLLNKQSSPQALFQHERTCLQGARLER